MQKKSEGKKIIFILGLMLGIMALSYFIYPISGRRERDILPEALKELSEDYVKIEEEGRALRIVSGIIEEETDDYIIKANFVVIKGMESEEEQINLNKKIKDLMIQSIDNFKTQVKEIEIPEGRSSFHLNAEATYFSEESISIKFRVSEYYGGVIDSNNHILVFNYNIVQGRKIALKDLFFPEIDHLEILSNFTKIILFERFQDKLSLMEDWIESGTQPKEENFQKFGFRKDNLIIYFYPRQFGPHPNEIQIIEVPFKYLARYINLEEIGF